MALNLVAKLRDLVTSLQHLGEASVKFSDLQKTLLGDATPLKLSLTEFNASVFSDAIILNLLSMEESYQNEEERLNEGAAVQERQCSTGNLDTLTRALEALAEAAAVAAKRTQAELVLTAMLHFATFRCAWLMSEKVRPPGFSQINWFVERIVQRSILVKRSLLQLPRPLAPQLFLQQLHESDIFRRNTAKIFSTFSPKNGSNAGGAWVEQKIFDCLATMEMYYGDFMIPARGFVFLRGIALKRLLFQADPDLSSTKTLLKMFYLTLMLHESGHYCRRKLIAGGDLNHSTPFDYPSPDLRTAASAELPASAAAEAQEVTHGASVIDEFGRFVERTIFGRRFDWAFVLNSAEPVSDSVIRSLESAIEKLTLSVLDLSEIEDRGHAIAFTEPQLAELSEPQFVREESPYGTFGLEFDEDEYYGDDDLE